ncbi:hypothetical protein AB1Y20_006105 [Prymnesium parvum]|uniref:Carboxypeptidase n=1 Tax=Prymnesium parvum TaxID=97485 RepID=A0AB34J3N0_PRYPA
MYQTTLGVVHFGMEMMSWLRLQTDADRPARSPQGHGWWKRIPFVLAVVGCAVSLPSTAAAPSSHRVHNLPDYGAPPSPQYAGFLDAGAAENGTRLFYWLALCDAPHPAECPTLLWRNGGPGSTSVIGMLQEHGPLLIGADAALIPNPFAWTSVANLLVIDAPAGVGFSYCAASLVGEPCSADDHSTAAVTAAALDHFFSMFPELHASKLFMAGESYAGVYVPTLARLLLEQGGSVGAQLKGIAVGDPCTDNAAQKDSLDVLWYSYKYGLVGREDFETLWVRCGLRFPSLDGAGAWRVSAGRRTARRGAGRRLAQARDWTRNGWMVAQKGYRPAHYYTAPLATVNEERVNVSRQIGDVRSAAVEAEAPRRGATPEQCRAAVRRFLVISSQGLAQDDPLGFINDFSLYDPIVKVGHRDALDVRMAKYMRREDVRLALHADDDGRAPADAAASWPGPGEGWSYKSSYAACNTAAPKGTPSMVDVFREIAPRLPHGVLVFNGDADPCISYEGTREAVHKVGFAPRQPYRPWFINATAVDPTFLEQKDMLFGPSLSAAAGGAQLGGYVVDYEHGLSFATVHGAGHMVPQSRPVAALKLIKTLVSGLKLSPPFPSSSKLAAMNDAEYRHFAQTWTEDARSSAYL